MMTKEFDRWVVLPPDCNFVPVKKIERLLWDACEASMAGRSAADAEAVEFDFGFRVDEAFILRMVLERRNAGTLRVFGAGGFGVIRDDDVLNGVLRRDDFERLIADEWHTGVRDGPMGVIAVVSITEQAMSPDLPPLAAKPMPTGTAVGAVVVGLSQPGMGLTGDKFAPKAPEAARRRNWWVVAGPYMVATLHAGQFANAKELDAALMARAGTPDSPFEKGEGQNRGSLIVREIGKPLALKTIQNNWQRLRVALRS